MKRLELHRVYDDAGRSTKGYLYKEDGEFLDNTLELPWRDNAKGISCIPEGTYTVKRDVHGKHTWFSVQDVPNRTYIEIHEGYKPEHSQGCILMSLIDLQDLMIYTQGEDFILEIKGGEFE